VEGHAGVTGPAVLDTEQLVGEDPAGGECLVDPRPQGREFLRRAERQAEACVNQVGVREVRLGERRAQDANPVRGGGRDARAKDRQPGFLSIYCQD
jgi:hypothetical protein